MLGGPSLPPVEAMDEPGTIPQGFTLCRKDHIVRTSRIKKAQIVGVTIDDRKPPQFATLHNGTCDLFGSLAAIIPSMSDDHGDTVTTLQPLIGSHT